MSFIEKKGKKWLVIYFILFLNFLLIDLMFIMLQNSWGDINSIVSDYIGVYINLVLIIVIIFIIPIVYGLILFITNLKTIRRNSEIKPSKINKILPLFLLLFFDLIIIALFVIYEQYTKVVFQILEYYSLIGNFIIFGALIILLFPLLKKVQKIKTYFTDKRLKSETKRNIICICIAAICCFYFIVPTLFFPANVVYGELPTKPNIMGHRGASHIAPENTLIALQMAADYGAIGVEIDVRYTSDGELVLMHDSTLTRTTDVAEKFPARKNDDIDQFTLAELKTLDAGSYFYDNDPYGAIASGIITQEQAKAYQGIQIPTLLEAINKSRDLNFVIDFDTKFSNDIIFEKMLNETIQSGISNSSIMIITDKPAWIQMINDKGMNDVMLGINMRDNPSLERYRGYEVAYEFASNGDDFPNNLYRQFNTESIPVMVYTIDSPERFNQLWCMGVTWVMTNEVHTFNALEEPMYLSIELYHTIWIILYMTAAISIVLIYLKLKDKRD